MLKPNTLRRQIERWLNEKRGQCYCDDCIAAALDRAPRRHVQDVTSRLGVCERGFCKYRGKCSACGHSTVVTAFSGMWV